MFMEDETFLGEFLDEVFTMQQHLRSYLQTPGAPALNDVDDVRALTGDAEAVLLSAMRKAGRRT